jgi:hypothetical protein
VEPTTSENLSLNQTFLQDDNFGKVSSDLVLDKHAKLYNWNASAPIIENLTNFELHLIGKGINTNQVFPMLRGSVPHHMRMAIHNNEMELKGKPWSEICKQVRRTLEPGKREADYEMELYELNFFKMSSIRTCINKFRAYAQYTDLKQEVLVEKFLSKINGTRYLETLRYHHGVVAPFRTLDELIKILEVLVPDMDHTQFVSEIIDYAKSSNKRVQIEQDSDAPAKRVRTQQSSDSRYKHNCPHCKKKDVLHLPEDCHDNPNNKKKNKSSTFAPSYKNNGDKKRPYVKAGLIKAVTSDDDEMSDRDEIKNESDYLSVIKNMNTINSIISSKDAKNNATLQMATLIHAGLDPLKDLNDLEAVVAKFSKPSTIDIGINNINFTVELDSGASNCVISQSALNLINKDTYTISNVPLSVQLADDVIHVEKQVNLTVSAVNKSMIITFALITSNTNISVLVSREFSILFNIITSHPGNNEDVLFLKQYKPIDLDEIIESQDLIDRGAIVYHNLHNDGMIEIQSHIDRNLAIINKNSTLEPIHIDFINEKDRAKGHWQTQHLMEDTVQDKYKIEVDRQEHTGIVQEIYDHLYADKNLGAPRKRTGLFNIRAFNTFSGKDRFVYNYTPINNMIESDTNDVPGIDELFRVLSRANIKIISKIDLRSAYYQIEIFENDRYITAFTCGNKRYQFITAPLGLKHIPSIFQRQIKSLLQLHGCADFTYNHIDDIVVYSSNFNEHVQHVQKVLDALTSVNLTINMDKCHFFTTKVPIVGFWVEANGIRPNYNKLANMQQWVKPTTKKQLQSYLGIINFFRRFIPNVTELLQPFLIIKEKQFAWTDKLQAAWDKVYHTLVIKVPFLYFPVKGIPIEIATDASDFGIGAAVFQRVDGVIRYLSFHSRILKGAEANYSTPKKELLSIVYHIEYYRHWFAGRHFHLYTDNQAMSFALQVHKNEKRDRTMLGWLAKLSEYDFKTSFIAGRSNTLPDLLSRVQGINSAVKIGKIISTNSFPYFNSTESSIDETLEAVHSIGHFGANAMYDFIKNNLKLDINDLKNKCDKYCKRCDICRRISKYTLGYVPSKMPKLRMPGYLIHCDIMEMPKSKLGHTVILVAVDEFSKFVWLRPCTLKSAKHVAEHLLDIFTTYEFSSILRSDRGKEYTNKLVENICALGNIVHKFTIAYYHSGNGRVERQNRTVRDTILKLLLDNKLDDMDWHTIVPTVILSMNARVHSTLKASPMHLMFGRDPFNCYVPEGEEGDGTFTESVTDLEATDRMKVFWTLFKTHVIENIHQIKLREHEKKNNKKNKNRKKKPNKQQLKVGDIVWWKIPNPQGKFQERNLGPFKIIKGIDADGLYEIAGKDGNHSIITPLLYLSRGDQNLKNKDLYNEDLDPDYFEELDSEDENEFSEVGVDDYRDESYQPLTKKKKR